MTVEIVGHEYAALCSIFMNIPFVIGELLMVAIAYFFRDFRVMLKVAFIPPVLCLGNILSYIFTYMTQKSQRINSLGIWFMIPESPRWLISVKKFKEAKSILMEAGKQNGQPLSKEDLSGISQDTDDDGHNNTSYWKDFKALFQNSCMRKRLIVMYIEFITVVLVYNGLTLNNMNLVRAN